MIMRIIVRPLDLTIKTAPLLLKRGELFIAAQHWPFHETISLHSAARSSPRNQPDSYTSPPDHNSSPTPALPCTPDNYPAAGGQFRRDDLSRTSDTHT